MIRIVYNNDNEIDLNLTKAVKEISKNHKEIYQIYFFSNTINNETNQNLECFEVNEFKGKYYVDNSFDTETLKEYKNNIRVFEKVISINRFLQKLNSIYVNKNIPELNIWGQIIK